MSLTKLSFAPLRGLKQTKDKTLLTCSAWITGQQLLPLDMQLHFHHQVQRDQLFVPRYGQCRPCLPLLAAAGSPPCRTRCHLPSVIVGRKLFFSGKSI